jgi:flagellar basal-body rod protein FlgF
MRRNDPPQEGEKAMDNTLYVALSRQQILRREMDVVANNIANADTPGFKVEQIISQTDARSLPGTTAKLQFALDTGLSRNFSQGAVSQTGRPLDVAIEGDGFFQINAQRGERFTRDGRFTLDDTGRLVTAMGEPVAGEGGDIVLDPARGEVAIAADGAISQNGTRVGKLTVWRFGSLAGLAKDGDGLYKSSADQAPIAATDAKVIQAAVEGSNVQPVIEVTRMIEVSREYERISRMMDQTAQLNSEAIDRLGKVS